MKYILLLLMVGLVGCSNLQDTDEPVLNPPPPTDPTFLPGILYFETIYKVQVNVSVSFDKSLDDTTTMGKCFHYRGQPNSSRNYVTISPKWWAKTTQVGKDALIFHELGHCVFDLDHNDGKGIVGGVADMPISLMNTYFFGDAPIYKNNKEYYDKHVR